MNKHTNELFIGRLGRNPELRYTKDQKPVCKLSVAVNPKDDTGPQWHKVLVWGKQAELASLYLRKGSEVFVQGRKSEKSFRTHEGGTKTFLEVNARLVGFTNLS